MADNNVLRIGQNNEAGDELAKYLKVATGEVLTAFTRSTQFINRHTVQTIPHGTSAQFIASGRTGTSRMTPGAEITGGSMPSNEVTIDVDYPLMSDISVWKFDEKMAHFDLRSEITTQLGEALAQTFDKSVAQVGVLAARAAANVNGLPGGSSIYDVDARTVGTALAGTFFSAAQVLDEKNVSPNDRIGFVKPAQYYLLVNTKDVTDVDHGGEGSVAAGTVRRIADIPLVKTNNLPTTNVVADAEYPAKYAGDFSNTAALVMNRQAVGTVKLVDIELETEYTVRRQSTLMVAKYMMGHGILRPEAAVEIATAAPAP